MITEDYVSFETAKLLKEKGFEPPHDYKKCIPIMYTNNGEIKWGIWSDGWYPRITLQMAMKWLREKEWFICIIPLAFYCGEVATQFGYNIWAGDNLEIDEFNTPKFRTYEEACENAIRYCLKNI